MDLFQECPTCAAKTGMPDLCPSCINNRNVILKLREGIEPQAQPVGMSRIHQELENGIVKSIKKGDVFKIPYASQIDISPEMKQAYANIDFAKVYVEITALLEKELAQKVVNKIITEMGTDIKKLMSHNEIREDFKYLMRKGVDAIMEKVKE